MLYQCMIYEQFSVRIQIMVKKTYLIMKYPSKSAGSSPVRIKELKSSPVRYIYIYIYGTIFETEVDWCVQALLDVSVKVICVCVAHL